MSQAETPPYVLQLIIFLSLILMLVGFQLIVSLNTARRIKRLENRLDGPSKNQASQESEPGHAETSPGGAFEAFLLENPERRKMVKSEQFAAYRKWRHEKGMNWANS